MDDKSRCLEQLALKIQRVTLVEVQKAFLLGDVEAGTDLLSCWEDYIGLSKTETKHEAQETFSTTIKLYCKRLGALQKVLDSLPKHSFIDDLQNELTDLEKKFALTKPGIGGGTFEWVDSILVKCLKDGAWLVIDNVNLCSPAVLDRLNGLLEPKGELVMGERGVRQDGELVTVTPHPNFRLFLLMNPHHGEISRAMRNRGVELCLLSPEERPFRPIDFQAILNHVGITCFNKQQALIHIHREMVNLAIGFESLSTNHLLQVATLTAEQAVRGRPFYASMTSACSDVYIQSRQLSLEQKERVGRMLSEILEEHKELLISSESDMRDVLDPRFVTLNTLSVQENSVLALLRQKCALFSTSIQLIAHNRIFTLKELLKDNLKDCYEGIFDRDLLNLMHQILLTLVSSISETDFSLRRCFITKIISSCQNNEIKKELFELEASLMSGVQKIMESNNLNRVDGLERKNLSWDLRRVSPWLINRDGCDFENKAIAFLYYLKQSFQFHIKQDKIKTSTVKNMTVLEFSTAYNKGQVTVASVKSDLVLGLSLFLEVLHNQMLQVLDSSANLDQDQCCQLISAYQWVLRLYRLAGGKLFVPGSRDMRLRDDIITLLALHISWTKKWLFPQLTRLLIKHSKRKESGRLPSELTELCGDLALVYPVRSLSKKVRAILGQPLPLNSNLQAQVLNTVARLETMLELKNVDHPKQLIQKRVEFLLSKNGSDVSQRYTELYSKALNTNTDLLRVLEELKEVETTLAEENLSSILPQDEISPTKQSKNSCNWEVLLWPVRGVVCLRIISTVLNTSTDQLISSLSAGMKGFPLMSTRLSAVLDNTADHPLLASNLLMNQLSRSPIVTSSRFWLTFSSLYHTNNSETKGLKKFHLEDHQMGEYQTYPLDCPLLSVFATALLFPQIHDSCDLSLGSPSLRNHRQHAALLQTLLDIIWTCGPTLGSSIFNYRKNERTCFEKFYEKFLQSVQTAVQTKLKNKELCPNDKNFLVSINNLMEKKTLQEQCSGLSKEVKELLGDMTRHIEVLENTIPKLSSDVDRLLEVGEGWTHLGLLELKLFTHMAQVDPVQINSLKVQYCQQEQDELENSLAVEKAQGIIVGSYHFPLAEAFSKRLEVLQAKELTLKKFVAIRPEPNVYTNLYNEIQQLMAVVVNAGRRVETVVTALIRSVMVSRSKQIEEAVNQAKSLLTSLLLSTESLDKKYGTWYGDVTVPMISALTKITHGLALMIGSVNNHKVNMKTAIEPLLRSLVQFPLPDCSSALDTVEVCTSAQLLELLQATVKSKLKPEFTASDETFRLAKCSLQELNNVICVQGEIQGDRGWSTVRHILDYLVKACRLQEQTRIEKEQQEASFFINKMRKIENLTEEEEDAIEMRKLFPSFREKDFADLEPASLEQDQNMKDVSETCDDSSILKLSEENIIEIHKVHSEMVTQNTKSHWIQTKDSYSLGFTVPFSDRFAIFSTLLDSMYEGCSSELDTDSIPALCLSVRLAQSSATSSSVEPDSKRKHYNFYHDSNIEESKQCVPILESLTKRVSELLDEWPDHPTLNQIMMVINRILDFPSSSPLSRFLVGLELLLTKLKEWEENAHSGVTLAPHAAVVTRQILDWRKEELAQWKGCFEFSRTRMCEKVVSKWWFHLYSLIQEQDGKNESSNELSTVLEQFMESSSLGEYQARLDLLYVFHCHAVNDRLGVQSNILWNIHQYYSQFQLVLNRRIKELSQPIEKKLKDFVKIARWNDINYWAVKETVDKTHRTLFKYIREYENILKEPARNAMTKLDPIGRKLFELSIDIPSYIAPLSPVEMLWEITEGDSLLGRQRSLFSKARKLCQESIKACSLPQDIEALQSVIEELKEVSELLAVEDVDRTLSKEKQKSAAKSVLHRKRKALSDMFHMLTELGLSYRAGLIKSGGNQFTTHTPLNVKVALEQIDCKPCDQDLLKAWAGCDQFFLHSVAFTAQLHSALIKPHKDLGPAIIERCKGFTNHLMYLCHQQKKCVAESVSSLYILRCLTQCLATLHPIGGDSSNISQLKNEFISTLEDVIFSLSQFEVLIDSCPASPDVIAVEKSTNACIFEESAVTISHGDEHFAKVRSLLTSAINSAKKFKSTLKAKGKFSKFLGRMYNNNENKSLETLLSLQELNVLKEGNECLTKINSDIKEIEHEFRMKDDNDVNPLSHCLVKLRNKIKQTQEHFNLNSETIEKLTNPSENYEQNQNVINEESKTVETLLSKMLFSIQEFYKKNVPKDSEPTENSINQNENVAFKNLSDSILKEKVIGELQSGVNLLNTREIITVLQHILKTCTDNMNTKSLVRCAKMCLPILEQYNLLVQYVITLQISALRTSSHISSQLVSLFVDFANKGFQVPEELLEEEGEGSETTAGGLGLGEGEGEKDVSDQIESKDQLEDAKKPGEHDKEEHKDCKEEENGIEMTDDFGGNLQDIDKKPDSDGSCEESGDEEEPDKEMGDTEKGAETLDEQIWGGNDSENEEEESGELKEEEGDKGEQMGDKEMGAKDDNKTPQEEEDDLHGNEDKKDKNKEINEMDEPEVDDDQIDPYHGKHQPQPEPEPLELPDDLQLDDGEGKDQDEEGEEENPFDIDIMKEPKIPEEPEPAEDNDELKENEEGKENNLEVDSSEDEEGDGEGQGDVPEDMDVDENEIKQEEDITAETGGAKDENKTGEEEKMEEDKEEEKNESKPSEDKPATQAVPRSLQDTGSKDQVDQPDAGERSDELRPEDNPAEGPDQQGVGAAPDKQQQDAQKGSKGESQQAIQSQANELKEEKRQRPGNSEEERALGDVHEPMKKKLKTINMQKENDVAEEEKENGIEDDQTAEMYQHIKEAKETSGDAQTLDAATEEQAAQQKVPNQEEEEASKLEDDKDLTIDQDEPIPEADNVTTVNPEKLKESKEKDKEASKHMSAEGERMETEAGMEVEGEVIETITAARGGESTFHTRPEALAQELAPSLDIDKVRYDLEQQLASWSQPPPCDEAARAWERLSMVTSDLSRELSEQLRLVLEPTHASRLKGDFRTGRRINMRKVIPYIASQFRKDKIWLRRTKPAKREYQIILAIDDSSSMADNHSKELAFESLAVVSKALNLLEAGQLSVLSFGEQPKILHQLGETFTEQSGAKLLQQFSFEQQKTQVGALVNFACSVFNRNPGRRGVTDIAQLLVIVSDGRGVMNDGEEVVRQAVRRAKHMGVFMVFVIIDNPQSKDSILDIRLPKFSCGKLLGIVPYMDSFPFPFYLILRDINSLPSVLSDALRQWFELVTASS